MKGCLVSNGGFSLKRLFPGGLQTDTEKSKNTENFQRKNIFFIRKQKKEKKQKKSWQKKKSFIVFRIHRKSLFPHSFLIISCSVRFCGAPWFTHFHFLFARTTVLSSHLYRVPASIYFALKLVAKNG